MRVFLGMILGACLTVLVAYVADAVIAGPPGSAAQTTEQRPMVNWDVVGQNWRELTARVTHAWHKVASG